MNKKRFLLLYLLNPLTPGAFCKKMRFLNILLVFRLGLGQISFNPHLFWWFYSIQLKVTDATVVWIVHVIPWCKCQKDTVLLYSMYSWFNWRFFGGGASLKKITFIWGSWKKFNDSGGGGGGGMQFFNDSSKNPTRHPYLVKNERSLRNAYFASFHLRIYSEKYNGWENLRI